MEAQLNNYLLGARNIGPPRDYLAFLQPIERYIEQSFIWKNLSAGIGEIGQAAYRGAALSLGFSKDAAGIYKFLGGASVGATLRGAGIGLGVGYIAYKASGDNPLVGIGAGIAGAKFLGRMPKGTMLGIMGPASVLYGMYEGWKEGGAFGALAGGAEQVATWAAFDAGLKAISVMSRGTTAQVAMKLVANPITLTLAAGGLAAYMGSKYLAAVGRQAVESEFYGNTAAFHTRAAYTMRQRALMEIQRSHTNSRTILGNEAQLMHF